MLNMEEKNMSYAVKVEEAARMLSVCEKTVGKLASEGKIKKIVMGRRCVRYVVSSINGE